MIRFADRESAMANSARPEQCAWAERMAALFDGPVEFHDSDDVTLLFKVVRTRPGSSRSSAARSTTPLGSVRS